MSGVIRTVPCGCESGQPCTPATRCAITTAVHIQREDDEAEMERLREDHEAELAALRAERDAALVAVKAMHKLLDRDWAIVDRDITLRCESHDQAWNYLHEMRDLVRAALGER